MKAIGSPTALAFGTAMAALVIAAPCRADAPLAGDSLFTVSHGQPFCTSRAALTALLRAQVAHAPYNLGPDCQFVADNAIVAVGADLRPRGRYMHVVRARATLPFGTVEGFTYSVGLHPYPVREAPFRLWFY